MARPKKLVSPALKKAQVRVAGLGAMDSKAALGKGLTVQSYTDEVGKLGVEIAEYNALLSSLDVKLNGIKKRERTLETMSGQVLRRIAADFGPDSDEYERVGGKRMSERKKPGRKA